MLGSMLSGPGCLDNATAVQSVPGGSFSGASAMACEYPSRLLPCSHMRLPDVLYSVRACCHALMVLMWGAPVPWCQSEVRSNMWVDAPAGASQLAAVYTFKSETLDPMSTAPGSKVRLPLRRLPTRCSNVHRRARLTPSSAADIISDDSELQWFRADGGLPTAQRDSLMGSDDWGPHQGKPMVAHCVVPSALEISQSLLSHAG